MPSPSRKHEDPSKAALYLQTLLETKESGHDLNEGNPFEIN